MLTKKMNNITIAAMWQESKISKKSQRIVLRYLSNFFGSRLVVPEYCIDELGHVPRIYSMSVNMKKIYI